MRVNIYAEEMTDKVELIEKETKDGKFVGVRFYLELPVTVPGDVSVTPDDGRVVIKGSGAPAHIQGPFIHHPLDNDSAAVTFWGKAKLKIALLKALALLEQHR